MGWLLTRGLVLYERHLVTGDPRADGLMHDSRTGIQKLYRRRVRSWDRPTSPKVHGRRRTALRALTLLPIACVAAGPARGQEVMTPGPGPIRSAYAMTVRPTLSLGGSFMVHDFSGDDTFRGWAVRSGVAVGWFTELTVGLEHWPELGPRSAWALQTEGTLYPLGRRRLAPYLVLHLGRFWATLPPGTIYTRELRGGTAGMGLGLHGRVVDPLGLRLEAVAR